MVKITTQSISSFNREYSKARPITQNIEKINNLYREGNTIVYWTARGSKTVHRLEEYTELTHKQLKDWGALHHVVKVGDKPAYDLIICDKSRRIEEI